MRNLFLKVNKGWKNRGALVIKNILGGRNRDK